MKSATWYVIHEGKKLLAATEAEVRRLAQLVADRTGKPVKVYRTAGKAAPAAAKPAKKVMRRNPDPGSYLYAWAEDEKGKAKRREYLAATKGRRLAKGLRGRDRGGAVKAGERAARKSGKFAVDVRNSREAYTLYRASRTAADQLVSQFLAAGYKVVLREV